PLIGRASPFGAPSETSPRRRSGGKAAAGSGTPGWFAVSRGAWRVNQGILELEARRGNSAVARTESGVPASLIGRGSSRVAPLATASARRAIRSLALGVLLATGGGAACPLPAAADAPTPLLPVRTEDLPTLLDAGDVGSL